MAYRVYTTDGLQYMIGAYKDRYFNMIEKEVVTQPAETKEQIVERTLKNGGLYFKE